MEHLLAEYRWAVPREYLGNDGWPGSMARSVENHLGEFLGDPARTKVVVAVQGSFLLLLPTFNNPFF